MRLAELDALRGGHAESAMTWIAAVLERSTEASGMAPVEAAAQRARAAALYQLGEPQRAAEALAEERSNRPRSCRSATSSRSRWTSWAPWGTRRQQQLRAPKLLTRLGVSRVARPPLD